ncbi:MAG: periplasmic heavy metal sensor [Syntrophales bacterium]|nr:periplasmic heavy metal sensor [Syntrophales bacterium]MDD5233694.1 periplasmic heavy metal sensor [Syntrophales bacterium]
MQKTISAWAIFLVFLVPVTGAAEAPGGELNFLPRWWEKTVVVKKLGLSERQASRIREIHHELRGSVTRCGEELTRQMLDLENLLVQSRIDEDRANRRIEAVQNAISLLAAAEIAMTVRMMEELSLEQRRYLLSVLHRVKAKPHKKAKPRKKEEARRYNRF